MNCVTAVIMLVLAIGVPVIGAGIVSSLFGRPEDAAPVRQAYDPDESAMAVRKWADAPTAVAKYFSERGGSLLVANSEDACLVSATRRLPDRCARMSHDQYRLFALRLANCHLERSGRKAYPCSEADNVGSCTHRMDDAAFGVYTQFYGHVQEFCRTAQQELRAEAADMALSALVVATDDTATRVELLSRNTARVTESVDGILDAQHAVRADLLQQAELSKRGLQALDEIGSRTTAISEAHETFAKTALDAIGGVATKTEEIGEASSRIKQSMEAAAEEQRRVAAQSLQALGGIADTASGISDSTSRSLSQLQKLGEAQGTAATALAGMATAAGEANVRQGELLVQQRLLAQEQEKMRSAHEEIMGSLKRLSWLQTLLFGEFLDIGSVAWYIAASVLCVAFTASDHTARARPAPVTVRMTASMSL